MSIICPACHHKIVKKSEFDSRENFKIEINICDNCGHFFQNPDNYQDLYTSGEFSQQARQSLEPTAEKIKTLDKRALERIDFYHDFIDKPQTVLEVGSSIGSFLHLLKIKGKEVTGLEPDATYASFSQKQYFFDQDSDLLENYNTKKKFDLVCSFHVIEHVQHLDSFIDKVWSLLNDDGALLFECPSLDIYGYGDMKYTIWKPHIHYFTLASMYSLISRKFKVLKLGYYGMSIFIYAQKSQESTYDKNEFKGFRKKSQRTSKLISLTPSFDIKSINKSKIRQFILQPVLQKDGRKKISRYLNLSSFAVKAFLYKKLEKGLKKNFATHISYYSAWENAGDTVLSKTVRKVFNSKFNNSWHLKNIKDKVDNLLLSEINKSKYLLIGGGGLLLPDSNKNSISGWQWAVSPTQLKEIEVPVIVYAIGYNYFKGQNPDNLFIENLNRIVEKADFFSLRNYGSIEKVKELVDEKLHSKIIYQPCPTTVINKFFKHIPKNENQKNVGINLAFDRYEKRFGKDIYTILDQIAITAKKLEENGYKIYCINHLKGDDKFELSLDRHNVKYKSVNLQFTLPHETIEFYSKMGIVLGARGHAQMIPFGVNTRILSLGTHEKLKYFLEDIDALEWYEDLSIEPHKISERLLEKVYCINERDVKESDHKLRSKQEELYQTTLKNIDTISNYIK